MNDARDNLPAVDAESVVEFSSGLDACAIQSHDHCSIEECEIRRYEDLRELTEGQIRVGVATAISGLIVSSVFALAVLSVWVFHALNGHKMPDIPFIIVSIASAPFAAGLITALKIPKKARVLLEEK